MLNNACIRAKKHSVVCICQFLGQKLAHDLHPDKLFLNHRRLYSILAKHPPSNVPFDYQYVRAKGYATATDGPKRNGDSKAQNLKKKKAVKGTATSAQAKRKSRVKPTQDLPQKTIHHINGVVRQSPFNRPRKRNVRNKPIGNAKKASTKDKGKKRASERLQATEVRKERSRLQIKNHYNGSINPEKLKFQVHDVPKPPVPRLAHGLEKVLFSPGVHVLRDFRSRVYNFEPYLELLMPIDKFDFTTLKQFTKPSKDLKLSQIAADSGKKYVASTSSLTGVLSQMHFLLSNWRPPKIESQTPGIGPESFTKITKGPVAFYLNWQEGTYAIDADKTFDSPNVLSIVGRYMEKLLTEDQHTFQKFRVGESHNLTEEERNPGEAFHYTSLGNLVIRSQLDAHDHRLPGHGIFDLKTRAVLPIRMDNKFFEWGMGYEITKHRGIWNSFEREFHDMSRATLLKYLLQVRLGRMDGIFVAYHNIARVFGFQYLPLEDMDRVIHGQSDRHLGDMELLTSLKMLNEILDRVTTAFPQKTVRVTVEAREVGEAFMYIFAEPVDKATKESESEVVSETIAQWERGILGVDEEGNRNEDDSSFSSRVKQFSDRYKRMTEEVAQQYGGTDSLGEDQPLLDGENDVTSLLLENKSESEPVINSRFAGGPNRAASDQDSKPDKSHNQTDTLRRKNRDDQMPTTHPTDEAQDSLETEPSQPESPETFPPKIYDTSSSADTAFLEQLQPKKLPKMLGSKTSSKPGMPDIPPDLPEDQHPPLLALVLSVKSRVNDRAVVRPEGLSTSDQWKVKYELQELSPPSRAWLLYGACSERRRKLFEATGGGLEEAESAGGHQLYYYTQLKNRADASRQQRAELDAEEAASGKGVLTAWDNIKRDKTNGAAAQT